MDQLNQLAQNMVRILSELKVGNEKYKRNIDKLQIELNAQVASLQNFINSNSATQSRAAKSVGRTKLQLLQQYSSENEAVVPTKRMKCNYGEIMATSKFPDCHCLIIFKYDSLLHTSSSHF